MPSAGVDDNIDVLHQPAMTMIMLGLVCLCLFSTVVNLRNVRLWMLRLAGVATSGVVDSLEIVTVSNGEVLRRPRVRYTTQTGAAVTAMPVVFRTKSPIEVGTMVRVSYAARRPERMVVHGFDARVRELVYAAVSLGVAIAAIVVFFASL